jgi:HlyD family secretion protein
MRIQRSRDWVERDIVDRSPAVSRLIRRQRIFIGCAVAAAALALAGLASSLLIKSPAQRAADAGPPNASQLTATVQKVTLKASVVVRGTVVSSGVVSVTTSGSAATGAQILTELPKSVGSSIASGEVIAAVSGRPIIVLPGPIPAYRDLKPGDVGPDVAQLQGALAQLGYPNSDPAGTFGDGTKQSVTKFYGARGFGPLTTGMAIDASGTTPIQQAQRAVSDAQRTVTDDQAAVSVAVGAAATSAKQQLAAGQQDLITAKPESTDDFVL